MVRILVICEAGPTVGTGHLKRCGWLAWELRRQGADVDIQISNPDLYRKDVPDGHCLRSDACGSYDRAVIDIPGATARVAAQLRAQGVPFILALDPMDPENPYVDEVVSLRPFSGKGNEFRTGQYAGLDCAILAPGFDTAARLDPSEPVRQILITFGGADPSNFTEAALRTALEVIPSAKISVVIGPAFQDADELESLCQLEPQVQVLRGLRDLAEPMRRADIVLCSGGGTLVEAAATGIPAIVVPQTVAERSFAELFSGCCIITEGPGLAAAIARVQDLNERVAMHEAGQRMAIRGGRKRVARRLLCGKESRSWIVFVGAGRWQLPGILRAQQDGLQVLALDNNPTAEGLAEADLSRLVDIRDPEAVVATVEATGIVPRGAISYVSDAGMLAAAALRERWILPGMNRTMARILTDKGLQRAAWSGAGLPQPRWHVASDTPEALEAIQAMGVPVYVKPTDAGGSRGVALVAKAPDAEQAVAEAFRFSANGQVLVEEFVAGTELVVDSFSHNDECTVLCVTAKSKVPGANHVANQLTTPAEDPSVTAAVALAQDALAVIGHTDGPGHTELILDANGKSWLIETAGRGGGFLVFDRMVPIASGYDLPLATIRQAVGRSPPQIELTPQQVLLRFFPSISEGIVRGWRGFEEASRVPGVEAGSLARIGDSVRPAIADADRLGYVLVHASNSTDLRLRAEGAARHIHFDIVPMENRNAPRN